MINVQSLGVLLRALQGGEPSPLAVPPTPRVARVAPIAPVASEGLEADSARSSASENGRKFVAVAANLPAKGTLASTTIASTSTGAATQAASDPATIVLLGRASAGVAPSPAAASASASLQLSGVAQLLDELRQAARPPAESAVTLRPAAPLVAGPEVEGNALALALKASIVQSGLFYESHLAGWVLQKYPQADLQHEPQAAWPTTPAATLASASASALSIAASGAPVADAGEGGPAPSAIALTHAAAPVVRDQLETLEMRQLLWSGAVWPGQQATIEIGEDASAGATGAPPAWRTRLTVELPCLGRVEADLVLRGAALQITLRTAESAQAAIPSAALDTLAETLRARSFDTSIASFAHGHAR